MVKVTLVVADWCPVCPGAKELWRVLSKEHTFEYEEVDISSSEGARLVEKYDIMAVPTTILDGKVAFVGVPDRAKAVREVAG